MEQLKEEFGKIYDQYIEKIYRFIYVKVNSQETAEDLSSEVFLRAWEAYREQVQNPNSKIQNIQAYLYQIARNILADHYRTKRIRIVSVEETVIDIVDRADPVEEKALQNIEIDRIKNMLSSIKQDYQDLIIWRYIEELSVPEIAQITGKTEQSVRVGVHRALQALKGVVDRTG